MKILHRRVLTSDLSSHSQLSVDRTDGKRNKSLSLDDECERFSLYLSPPFSSLKFLFRTLPRTQTKRGTLGLFKNARSPLPLGVEGGEGEVGGEENRDFPFLTPVLHL
ncbi:hypothetical protein NPIL_118971 [Nephila pilipes]|uniref:Uncharacterized protein n=1 Tax=Nephila pilipes TaxID=299642 RepID=A0A8X6T8G6_NEPPI|nr:hypothetical protein NPIL_118971 [Nephila pilipes]